MTVTTWTPFAFERVQVSRQRRDQGLALAGDHLGDVAAVEDHAAHELDVIVPHLEEPTAPFATDGERVGEDVFEGLPLGQPLAEFRPSWPGVRRRRGPGGAGSISLIRATIGRIRRICRSFELPNRRISPSETRSVNALAVSVVLSQMSLSSSIADYASLR